MCISPTIFNPIWIEKDIINNIEVIHSEEHKPWYKTLKYNNIEYLKEVKTKGIKSRAVKKYTRLRLRHTNITHRHILKLDKLHNCSCNETFNLKHILYNCNSYKPKIRGILKDKNIDEQLTQPSEDKIIITINALKQAGIYKYIENNLNKLLKHI